MKLSKKCQYALKAVFELASRNHNEPVKTHEIARSQRISPRFTEVILNELKHGGFVESVRGNEGGYLLSRSPDDLTVKEVIECIEGPISLSQEKSKSSGNNTVFGDNAFTELWKEVDETVSELLNGKTFADLINSEMKQRKMHPLNYNI
jgi:Rrf2 family cysteine metabolism transcriptional repressor